MKFRQRNPLTAVMLTLICILAISCGDDKGTDPGEPRIPVLTTTAVSNITRSTVETGGKVISDNGHTVNACGVCWSKSNTPTLADNSTSDIADTAGFTSSIQGLELYTTYYVRAYATNSEGTGYGNTVSFTTLDSVYSVIDIGGNEYRAISIGTQVWMTENLKVTQYRNGDHIPYVSDAADWIALSAGALCYYDNDPAYLLDAYGPYGCLYNWYAVNDSRGLAPEGWHIPSEAEWQTLVDYLGGDTVAGGKMKEVGTDHWHSPNTGATNECRFTALPGGYRIHENGSFQVMGTLSGFWSSTGAKAGDSSMGAFMVFDGAEFINYWEFKVRGLSVRCIKD